MTPLQQVMGELDAALTNKPFKEATNQFHHMPTTVEEWLAQPGHNPLWYLSDGGYSRIVFSIEGGYLFLTSNSSSRVKDRWEQAKPQRDAVEKFVRSELVKLYPDIANGWPTSESADKIVDRLLS